MPLLLRENTKEILYAGCEKIGFSDLGISLQQQNLQILIYHGVCGRRNAEGHFIPSYFVYRNRFQEQMSYLKEKMNPVGLLDAVEMIRTKEKLPPKSIVVTFDDGYLNNISEAAPVLNEFKIPATIFLATGYVKSGELFPFDKRRLLLRWVEQEKLDKTRAIDLLNDIPTLESVPFNQFVNALNYYWGRFEHLLEKEQRELLCPMGWASLKHLNSSLISFGAHTENHVVLSNEDLFTRKKEIVSSVDTMRETLGISEVAFSYPVGEEGCFDEQDKRIVQEAGCCCAVTGFAGSNSCKQDIFSLMRRSVSLSHRLDIFVAELAGIRQRICKYIKQG